MSWRIFSIQKLWPSSRDDLLPTGEFTLYDKKLKVQVSGWLPCHHGDVGFTLQLSPPNDKGICKIWNVIALCVDKRRGRPILQQISKKMSKKKRELYQILAQKSRESLALWTLAVVYNIYNMPLNINDSFSKVVSDATCLCRRGDPLCLKNTMYNREEAVKVINRALIQMGELPKSLEWTVLEHLIEWQCSTRYDTASKKQPTDVAGVEKYQNKWADIHDINCSRQIATHLRPDNTTLMQGDPSQSKIPEDAIVLVRNTNDAYKWQSTVSKGQLCMMTANPKSYKALGVSNVRQLTMNNPHLFIAYAHLWSIEEIMDIFKWSNENYTFIGRLDQYPRGRGQLFRDMCDSNRFDCQLCVHAGAEALYFLETMPEIEPLLKQYGVIQCFSNSDVSIQLNRLQLTKPYRIRTVRPQNEDARTLLFEEHTTVEKKKDSSVVNIRSFHDVRPMAGIIVCSEKTTSFDIHAARTQCKDALYVVGTPPPMFSFKRRPPKRNTINPFINS